MGLWGIDLGQTSRSVAGMSADGHGVFRRRVARDGILALLTGLSPCAVAMEAGGAPGVVMPAEAGLLEAARPAGDAVAAARARGRAARAPPDARAASPGRWWA
jgi:hypothetical protein